MIRIVLSAGTGVTTLVGFGNHGGGRRRYHWVVSGLLRFATENRDDGVISRASSIENLGEHLDLPFMPGGHNGESDDNQSVSV